MKHFRCLTAALAGLVFTTSNGAVLIVDGNIAAMVPEMTNGNLWFAPGLT